MFRRKEIPVNDIVLQILRQQGLETPLLQRRLIALWEDVVGPVVARYTKEKYIKNQTLVVKVSNAALRADLTMFRSQLCDKLNAAVGARIISEVRIIWKRFLQFFYTVMKKTEKNALKKQIFL